MQNESARKNWSRRDFGKGLLAAAATVATAGVTGAWAGQEAPRRSFAPGNYFDIHTHLGQTWGDRPALSADALLRWMDENDIAQAAVLPLVSPESWDHILTTDYVLRETAHHRDRLIPFCAIDPRSIHLQGYQAKVDRLKRYVDAGARGFGEHKVGIPMDDPRNIELFAACGEVGLPVVFHLDSVRNTDEPGLPALEKVLQEAPDTNMIGHAQGWWASISGGVEDMQSYPSSDVVPGGAIDDLMDRYPNLYGDLSAGSGANAIQRDPEFGRAFLIRRADRLLFGTDYLAPGQNVPQLELYRSLDLPGEVQDKIFRENARRLILDR